MFKESSHRWRADAGAKWKNLKRVSECATREAKTCRQSGDAAERELAALKSAFRSFLKTLWDDLRSRPVGAAVSGSSGTLPERGGASTQGRLDSGKTVSRPTIGVAAIAAPAGLAIVRPEDGKDGSAGVVSTAREGEGRGGGQGGPFSELTEAEVSDIMQALRVDSSSSSFANQVAPAPPAPQKLKEIAPLPPPPPTQSLPGSSGLAPASLVLDREFEGEEAFAARVESALGGQNTSAALADMLRSLREQGFSKGAGGAVDKGGSRLPPQQQPPAQLHPPHVMPTPPPTAWSNARTSEGWTVGSRDQSDTLERWSHALEPSFAGDVLLGSSASGVGGGGGSGGGFLSPLEEVTSGSPSEGAASGFGGGVPNLAVEDIASL